MASEGAAGTDQITELKTYLKTIMAKQEELKEMLSVKHEKAAVARRLSSKVGGGSLRNMMVEQNDAKHTATSIETPGMQKRLEDYSHNVEALEKELEETTKLVNEVATALAVLSAAGQTPA